MNALIGGVVVATGLAACAGPRAPQDGARVFRFRTPDGFTIAAELHVPEPGGPAAPLVVLGHELESSRRAWDPLVPRLVAAGYGVVIVDHRGFGESTKDVAGPAQLTDAARAGLGLDLLGALDAVGGDARVDTAHVAVLGTGISVPAAVRCARERPSVRAAILLVGMLDPDDEDFLLATPDFPVLMVAAAGDERGVGLMRQYARRFSGPNQIYVEMGPISAGDSADWRGSRGVATDTGLADLILWFLARQLPVPGAPADVR
jgi:pimeloyl-ACP methyl ester carboxylesterase